MSRFTDRNRHLREALRDIALFPIPVRTIDTYGEVVEYGFVENMRKMAHDALVNEDPDPPAKKLVWRETDLVHLETCISRLETAGFGAAALDLSGQALVLEACREFVRLKTTEKRSRLVKKL